MQRKSSLPTRLVAGARRPAGPTNFVRRRLLAPAFLLAALLAPSTEADSPYLSARILFPGQDEALRSNGGEVWVEARVAPALRPQHRVQLLLDGAATGPPQVASRFRLIDLHRGAHGLQLRVVDAAGEVLFVGQPSEFHLLRHSRLH